VEVDDLGVPEAEQVIAPQLTHLVSEDLEPLR
jgi:hypothetical protein